MNNDISRLAKFLIIAGLTLVPLAFGGIFMLFIGDQDVVSPLYISLGVVYMIMWGFAGYLCGRLLIPFRGLLIINAVPLLASLATVGMEIYAFFFERANDVALSDGYYLTEYTIGFTGVSFPALIARYMMNITAVNYNIFLIGVVLLITPFAFCYINGFSNRLEIKNNVPDIDGKNQDKA